MLRGIASWAAVLALLRLAGPARSRDGDANVGGPRSPAREAARKRLAEVRRWGCQYQRIDLAAIGASALDLVVIEPIVDGATGRTASRAEIDALKARPGGGRRLVLAYLSVGAAEAYRPYWRTEWNGAERPDWLGAESREWPQSYSVRYWHDDWQRLLVGATRRLVEAGYDGAFLDRVDAFHDWRESRASAQADMTELVVRLATTARQRNPAFLLVGQNAEQLLADPRYRAAIDAISKESLLTGLRGEQLQNAREDVEWSLSHLLPAQAAGLPVLSIEYLHDRAQIAEARQTHEQLDFVPFFATRLLDRLP
jgi:cysteinyl-tRNA synthetase